MMEKTPPQRAGRQPPSRRRSAGALLLALAAPLASAAAAPADRPPNIILFLADDLGWGELGAYGQEKIHTPRIDRMAREGVRFTDHYSGNAVCAPSRCSLLTGKHPGHAYIRSNGDPKNLGALKERYRWVFPGQNPIPRSEVAIAQLLKRKGYATGAFGKWGLGHCGTTGDPALHGFDLFYGYYCQRHAHNHYPRFLWRNGVKEPQKGNDRTLTGQTWSQDRFTEEALAFVRRHRGEPFFLYLPYAVPHLSIQAPEEAVAPYRREIEEEEYVHRGYLKHPTPRAGYAAMVTRLDRDVGRVLDLVAELGLDERTVAFFSSDNGPTYNRLGGSDSAFFHSAGAFRGLKGSLYEGGIRVPLVARWPGRIPAGRVSGHVSAFWDLFATIAEVAGCAVPAGTDGISFLPALLGEPAARQRVHDFLYWEFPGYGGQQAVRMGRWKAIRQNMLRAGNPDPLRIELYDLKEDAGEKNDVASRHPEIVARAREILRREHTPSTLFPMAPIDPAKR